MKFSTLILLGLVLVVACASADDSTTAASTTSTTVKPKSCDTKELNKLKDSICEELIQESFIKNFWGLSSFALTTCKIFVTNAVNILKCDCGRAA